MPSAIFAWVKVIVLATDGKPEFMEDTLYIFHHPAILLVMSSSDSSFRLLYTGVYRSSRYTMEAFTMEKPQITTSC